MEEYEGKKQAAAKEKIMGIPAKEEVSKLIARCVITSKGNPGLQDMLFRLCLFGFGLWEPFTDIVNPKNTALLIQSLVKPGELSPEEQVELSKIVINDLFRLWGGTESSKRTYRADIELTRLAVLAKETTVLAAAAEDAVWGLNKRFQYRDAAGMAGEAIAILDEAKVPVPAGLLRAAGEVSQTIGDVKNARFYISRAVKTLAPDKEKQGEEYAYVLTTLGRLLKQSGSPDEALSLFQKAEGLLRGEGSRRERAIIMRDIARILNKKGEIDKALEIHKEEIKVYEELGDKRERAITLGDIARIQTDKGNIAEALKLHRERLSVYEQLGDTRSRAVTLRDIARIHVSKGEVEEALTIHKEGLDVFKELGDQSEQAVTLWDLAHIELQREDHKTAFEYLSESYAINLKIGRLEGICFVGIDLGQLLCLAGNKEEGLKILERSRDGFKKMGQDALAKQAQEIIDEFNKPGKKG